MAVKYFVWIAGLRGPEPQIWTEKEMYADGKVAKFLACHVMGELDPVNVDQLKKLYPMASEAKDAGSV